jgi:hypothetical protein
MSRFPIRNSTSATLPTEDEDGDGRCAFAKNFLAQQYFQYKVFEPYSRFGVGGIAMVWRRPDLPLPIEMEVLLSITYGAPKCLIRGDSPRSLGRALTGHHPLKELPLEP